MALSVFRTGRAARTWSAWCGGNRKPGTSCCRRCVVGSKERPVTVQPVEESSSSVSWRGASPSVERVDDPPVINTRLVEASVAHQAELCDSGLPDAEFCALEFDDEDEPLPDFEHPVDEALSRGRWLLGLLVVQSMSSVVLDQYQDLLKEHLVVTLFLTMLVGAGGNAGNQSAIKVIRGLATGVIKPTVPSIQSTMAEQATVGLLLGSAISAGGFLRVYMTNGDMLSASAISLSLFMIVMSSVVLGAGLPFVLTKLGLDPANAGTTIQVLMDILGVAIACATCNIILVQLAESLAHQ